MIASGLEISWDLGSEFVSIDLENPQSTSKTLQTFEWWPSEKRLVHYNATLEGINRIDGGYEVRLRYNSDSNTHLAESGALWGTSIIRIYIGADSGVAEWVDESDEENCGIRKWRRISTGLFKTGELETVTRLKRKQELLRAALISIDQRCVLSLEDTSEALEAAHIIPSRHLGAEVIENSILLRADIHRLLDAGMIRIDSAGKVTLSDRLPENYRNLITVTRLPAETLHRVSRALSEAARIEA